MSEATEFKFFEPANKLIIARADGSPLVTISLVDGSIEYGEGYTPDEAAQTFWKAITDTYPKPEPTSAAPPSGVERKMPWSPYE